MARSVGKIFEENWKNSCPSDVWIYRPPDSAQGFYQDSNLRFSRQSPCDYMMFDGDRLFCLELKTVAGKSISFEQNKKDKGTIHYYQIDSLKDFAQYRNVISGLLIDFRGTGNTWFLDINEWDGLISSIAKKSFTEEDLTRHCSPILIEKKKLRVNYRYDIDRFLEESKGAL